MPRSGFLDKICHSVISYLARAKCNIIAVYAAFSADKGPMLAAALSFYALLSLAPILLLSVAVFAYILGSPEKAYSQIIGYVREFSPVIAEQQGAGIRSLLEDLIRGRRVAWGLGVISLLWSAGQIFITLQTAMNTVWGTQPRRGFLRQRLIAFLLMIILTVLFIAAFGISAAAAVVKGFQIPVFKMIAGDIPFAWDIMAAVLPFALVYAVFLIVYKFVPNIKVGLRPAATGAGIATALWSAARWAFGFYAANFADFSAVYGPIAGVIFLALWIYYSAIVTVIGAESTAICQGRKGF